jgi:putative SOS response-associated peptidase YedK
MCGLFTAMTSWREAVAFSKAMSADGPAQPDEAAKDEEVTYRVMQMLPVIVWDTEAGVRRNIKMRWGFPHRTDWRRPDPIHVRSETIDEKPSFRSAFLDGQRGIVLMKTFNEGLELPNGKTEQHTITPGDDAPLGYAVIWRRFEIEGVPVPLVACVMATVEANKLIMPITNRMPALIHQEDWGRWIGEDPISPAEAKELLKTVEGVRWTMNKPERAARKKRTKPTVSDPEGLF